MLKDMNIPNLKKKVIDDFENSDDSTKVYCKLSMIFDLACVITSYVDDIEEILKARGLAMGVIKHSLNGYNKALDHFNREFSALIPADEEGKPQYHLLMCQDYEDLKRMCDTFCTLNPEQIETLKNERLQNTDKTRN